MHSCATCGYSWEHGADGSHDCATILRARLDAILAGDMAGLPIEETAPTPLSTLEIRKTRPGINGYEVLLDGKALRARSISLEMAVNSVPRVLIGVVTRPRSVFLEGCIVDVVDVTTFQDSHQKLAKVFVEPPVAFRVAVADLLQRVADLPRTTADEFAVGEVVKALWAAAQQKGDS